MNYIHYFNYNNYLNRTIKGYDNLRDYISNSNYISKSNLINFNKINDITADVVYVSNDATNKTIPNYAIVTDEFDNIISRWFVISEKRNNKNNYSLELRHDLIYDNLNLVLNNEKTLIEKGYCPSTSDAILNSETFSFNEFKQNELWLSNGQGWVVMMMSGDTKPEKLFYSENSDYSYDYFTGFFNGIISTDDGYSSKILQSDNNISLITNYNKKGYYYVALPLVFFTKEIVYFKMSDKLGNFLDVITRYNGSSTASVKNEVNNSKDIMNVFGNLILSNETIIDIQVVPYLPSISISYTPVTDNIGSCIITFDKVNFNANYSSSNFMITATEYHNYENNTVSINQYCCPIMNDINFSETKTLTLNDLGISNVNSLKKLEAYKMYLQSPDRTSNTQIDLRNFINKNTGNLENITFEINYMIQPFQSYMYVKPKTNGETYFGMDDQDGRYLLCGYNNQILRTTNAWQSFLLNNKNYLNSFNLEMRDAK
jgi:hypothetical protein